MNTSRTPSNQQSQKHPRQLDSSFVREINFIEAYCVAILRCAKLHTKLKQYPEAEAMCEEAIQLFEQTCGRLVL